LEEAMVLEALASISVTGHEGGGLDLEPCKLLRASIVEREPSTSSSHRLLNQQQQPEVELGLFIWRG